MTVNFSHFLLGNINVTANLQRFVFGFANVIKYLWT